MSTQTVVRTVLDRLASDGQSPPGPAPGVTELLASAPAAHRRAVTSALGLASAATAAEIGAAIRDRERLAAVLNHLSAGARRLATRAAYRGDATVYQSWSGRPDPDASELERHGLAFAFRRSHTLEYYVPFDLHEPLADALAAPYVRELQSAEPDRWLEAPLQFAHDIAALWAHLTRSPARVKADGSVYQRDVPKLLAALPRVELHGVDDPIARFRLEFLLEILCDEGLVAMRVDDLPGSDARRQLIAAGNPASLLARAPDELRARLCRHVHLTQLGAPALALARRLAPGKGVSIKSFGVALRTLSEEMQLGIDPRTSDFALGMGGLHFIWLAGAVAVGVNHDGTPTAVCATPDEATTASRIVCQANFELVALAPPTPAERLLLALTCESMPDQAHVFRLTRDSVRAGQRCGILEHGVAPTLEQLTDGLPQNVARSVADWTSSVRRPLRLRTAMLLDTGDAATADAVLAGDLGRYVVERLGPSQLAIRASDIRGLQAALRDAGHELDPGLDRVSGRWSERDPIPTEAELVWAPRTGVSAPEGKQASMIAKSRRQPVQTSHEAAPLGEDPVDVVLDAIERGSDVFIVYAGAKGTTQRQITPFEIEGAAVHAYCHLRRDERSFWLASIVDAIPAGG